MESTQKKIGLKFNTAMEEMLSEMFTNFTSG